MRRFLAISALVLAACASPRPALTPPDVLAGIPKAKVLLLGTFHFDDPKRDTYKPKYPYDTMSPRRQKEIAGVVDALAAFHPTKVGLEFNPDREPVLNQRYADFLAGKFEMTPNEIYQIGFRLAKAAHLDKVNGIDQDSRFYQEIDPQKYAKEHGQEALLNDNIGKRFTQLYEHDDELKTKVPLRDYLLYYNSPARVRLGHGDYLHGMIDLGKDNDYTGADFLTGWWYARNIRIYENVRRLVTSPNDRIVVLIGGGHLPILRHLFESAPDIELVDVKDVLR